MPVVSHLHHDGEHNIHRVAMSKTLESTSIPFWIKVTMQIAYIVPNYDTSPWSYSAEGRTLMPSTRCWSTIWVKISKNEFGVAYLIRTSIS